MPEINLNDVVQLQTKETAGTDEAFRKFYELYYADKLDALYELFCQIGDRKISDGNKYQLNSWAAGIENGYDNAYHTMSYKEGIFGEDNTNTELPI